MTLKHLRHSRAILGCLVASAISGTSLAAQECRSPEVLRVLQDNRPEVVKTLEEHWLRAYSNRDTEALNCILAADFEIGSMPGDDSDVHDKKHVVEWAATRTGTAELEQLRIQSYETAVVARGRYSVRRDGKIVARFQFTDFFVYRDHRWQAVTRALAQLPVH
jgi:hypothetical protein